jgi:excisionase family DNA binding protein
MAPPSVVPLREAAERLASGRSTLRGWIREGYLPATKIGRRLMISENDLCELIARGRVVPREEGT